MDKTIIGIRFQKIGKLYHFDASRVSDIDEGDFAVVSTSRGTQLGRVVAVIDDPPKPPKGTWKRIERKATAADLLLRQMIEKKEVEALVYCRERVAKHKLAGLKIVDIDMSLDSKNLTVLFNTEGEDEIDLSRIRKDMGKQYSSMKVDFRRIGPRDVAKSIGGMGACGLTARCCSTFLTEFSPISIRMAKAQGVSLDPSEITGICGRLRCCLLYEYEHYVTMRKELPKRGKKVETLFGEGKVVDAIPLRQTVVVRLDDEDKTRVEVSKDDIEPWDDKEAARRKAEVENTQAEDGDKDHSKRK